MSKDKCMVCGEPVRYENRIAENHICEVCTKNRVQVSNRAHD